MMTEMTPDPDLDPPEPDLFVGDVEPKNDVPGKYIEVVQEGMDAEVRNERLHNDNPDDFMGATPQEGEKEPPDLDAIIAQEEADRQKAITEMTPPTMDDQT